MMSCRSATDLHTEAREGALKGFRAFRYRFHMIVCVACRAYSKGLELTINALHDLPKERAPDSIRSAALERLRRR